MIPPRIQLFEFGDLPFLPGFLRKALRRILVKQTGEFYLPILPDLQGFLILTESNNILDLASGEGGPWPKLLTKLAENGSYPSLQYSDVRIGNVSKDIKYYPESVDILSLDWPEADCYTLFTAFHHFSPNQAQEILQYAANKRHPCIISEFTERRWSNIFGCLLAPLTVWNFWPVLPLIYAWDAMASHFRSYHPLELQEMVAKIKNPDYQWEIKQIKHPRLNMTITCLMDSRSYNFFGRYVRLKGCTPNVTFTLWLVVLFLFVRRNGAAWKRFMKQMKSLD